MIKITRNFGEKRGKRMERKHYSRGTMIGGVVRIIVALITMAIAGFVVASGLRIKTEETAFVVLFMCFVGGLIVIASLCFIGSGIKMIIDGKKSFGVASKGRVGNGRILDLSETQVIGRHSGGVSHYTVYNLKFEYTDDFGNLCESEEQVSQSIYERLRQVTLVPILVYRERAIFDKKRFDRETVG